MTRLVRTLLAGFALLGTFQLSQGADFEAQAVLLVAHPDFRDPAWAQSVLLAAPLPHGGHVGVIINRPTSTTLGELFPGHASSQKVVDPVHFGGPFSTNVVVAVVRSDDGPGAGALALSGELSLAIAGHAIDRVIERTPQAARYYAGLVVWQPGELEMELAKGLWSVREADVHIVFRKDTKGLWQELSQPARGLRV